MNSKKSLLKNLSNEQKEMINGFDDETVLRIFHDRNVALEYAKKGISKTASEESFEEIADYMQILTRIVLEERGISTES